MDYFWEEFPTSERTAIAVNIEEFEKSAVIDMHRHRFYEFVMVTRGSCTHYFRGAEVLLIAGDIFLIPPRESHGYRVTPNTCIVNCYFFPERQRQLMEYISAEPIAETAGVYDPEEIRNQYDSLLHTIIHLSEELPAYREPVPDSLSRQGVLHLEPEDAMNIEAYLRLIHAEDSQNLYQAEYMKTAYLQIILVIFQRVKNHRSRRLSVTPDSRKQSIMGSLVFMEQNYSKPLTVREIAAASAFSESYFRKLFKEVTGLSPLDYLNRLRVVKALEFIQRDGMSIAEAAARVGVSDANYFTRMFKKIMGHAPHYFK